MRNAQCQKEEVSGRHQRDIACALCGVGHTHRMVWEMTSSMPEPLLHSVRAARTLTRRLASTLWTVSCSASICIGRNGGQRGSVRGRRAP